MKYLNNFKKITGVEPSSLTEDIFITILQNKHYKELFDTPEKNINLIEELLTLQFPLEFKKELYSVKYSIQLVQNEEIINSTFNLFTEKKINRNQLKEKLENFFNSSDPLFVISSILCSIIAFQDKNIINYKDLISENIIKIKNIFDNELGRIETTYPVRCTIVDLIYQFRENYYQLTGEDISNEIKWVDDETDKLITYKNSLIKPFESDIPPEQLGCIDITKLKK